LINLVVEGVVDEAVLNRVVQSAGLATARVFGKTGKQHLLENIRRYNQAAHHSPWVALIDFDGEEGCVGPFVARHLPMPSKFMRFRVAVREVEAWLMADSLHLASFLRIARAAVPAEPDSVTDPKLTMVNLARASRSSRIRRDMVPRPGSGANEGPAYASRLIEFVTVGGWRVDAALAASESLRRCVHALATLPHD